MKHNFKIIYLLFFSLLLSEIKIPPFDLDNWNVLKDKNPWIGCRDYNDLPWCRSIDIFPYSISDIEFFVGNFDSYSLVFHRMESSEIVDTNIVYLRVDYPLFLSDRDYIVKYNSFQENNDVIYQWTAIEHQNSPVYDDVIRLINAAGEFRLAYISPDSTEVSYSWNGELLGDFPNFYLETAWKTGGTEIMQELRQAIENKNK